MKVRIFLLVAAFFMFSSFRPVRDYEKIDKQQNAQYTVFIGGSIFKITKTSDLPNAFGKADIFGGKVDKGYIDLRFYGGDTLPRIKVYVTYVDYKSNETTMSRYGQTRTYATTNVSGNNLYTSLVTYTPKKGETVALPANSLLFEFDYSKTRTFTFESVNVIIDSATTTQLNYHLTFNKEFD